MKEQTFISVVDAAKMLGCHKNTIRAAVHTGKLAYVKINRKIFIPMEEFTPRTLDKQPYGEV